MLTMETINLKQEDRLNLKNIKYLFTDKSSKACFVYETNQFYRYPSNNNIIDNICFHVELYIVSNDDIKLDDYYITPDITNVKYGVHRANTERLVQIANEYKALKVLCSTQELDGIPKFSDRLADLAIKQLNSVRPKK